MSLKPVELGEGTSLSPFDIVRSDHFRIKDVGSHIFSFLDPSNILT